jgi:hypothetical protein
MIARPRIAGFSASFPMSKAKPPDSAQLSATIGFEAELWLAADKLCNNMDAAVRAGLQTWT